MAGVAGPLTGAECPCPVRTPNYPSPEELLKPRAGPVDLHGAVRLVLVNSWRAWDPEFDTA